jgi:hypothetical protein
MGKTLPKRLTLIVALKCCSESLNSREECVSTSHALTLSIHSLLDHGADINAMINAMNRMGHTPLMQSCSVGANRNFDEKAAGVR